MLNQFNPVNLLTTANPSGAATRYTIVILSAMATAPTIWAALPADIQATLTELAGPWGKTIAAVVGLSVALYGIITKSNSDKAQTAANLIDKELDKDESVEIVTSEGKDNLFVHPPKQ